VAAENEASFDFGLRPQLRIEKFALQIIPALLYFCPVNLTFTAQERRLFVTIALVRQTLREQVSGGLFIKQDLNRQRRIKIFNQRKYRTT